MDLMYVDGWEEHVERSEPYLNFYYYCLCDTMEEKKSTLKAVNSGGNNREFEVRQTRM